MPGAAPAGVNAQVAFLIGGELDLIAVLCQIAAALGDRVNHIYCPQNRQNYAAGADKTPAAADLRDLLR